jgi:hypothetical protein
MWLHVLAWLPTHWALIPVILMAIPMITFNLSYEPFWQDEWLSPTFDVEN